MNREESIAKMAQLRNEVEESCKSYNDVLQNGKLEDARKVDAEMTEKINEYTSIARDMCFAECRETGDPMLAAVKRLSYMTIGVKDSQTGEDKIPVREVINKEKQIDLLRLDKFCGGIGADKNWAHIAMKMNFLLTAQKCVDLGIDPKSINDSYAMSEIARGFNMGKNPTSKTNMLKTLQTVVSAMLGDGYKATSHDVNFLLSVFSKKNRAALTVTCANHRYMRGYLAEICHRIVTGASYNVDYKKSKDAPASPVIVKEAPKAEEKAA